MPEEPTSNPQPQFITHYAPASTPQPQQGIPVAHPKAHKPLYKLLNNMLSKKLPRFKTSPRLKQPKTKTWKKKLNYY